jgi:hypothetical protein
MLNVVIVRGHMGHGQPASVSKPKHSTRKGCAGVSHRQAVTDEATNSDMRGLKT